MSPLLRRYGRHDGGIPHPIIISRSNTVYVNVVKTVVNAVKTIVNAVKTVVDVVKTDINAVKKL
jgi:hypothetical protein